jgi:putative Holliday junction resolvase
MNILSIDYGEKRIGLAWVDTGIGVVLPFGLALNEAELIKIIQEEKPDKLIIGLPLSLQNQETKHTEEIRKFADKLTSQIDVPIEFFDERFTSCCASASGARASPTR